MNLKLDWGGVSTKECSSSAVGTGCVQDGRQRQTPDAIEHNNAKSADVSSISFRVVNASDTNEVKAIVDEARNDFLADDIKVTPESSSTASTSRINLYSLPPSPLR